MTFDRSTDRARRVVELAEAQARELGHPVTGTGHLILGMLTEGECVAMQVLNSLGYGIVEALTDLDATRRRDPAPPETPGPHWSASLCQILKVGAAREALQLAHNYIGTEHLLLAIASNREPWPELAAGRMLARRGITPGQVRQAVMAALNGYQNPAAVAEREEALAVLVTAALRYAAAEYAPRIDCGPGTETTREQIERAARRLYQAIETDTCGPRPAGWNAV